MDSAGRRRADRQPQFAHHSERTILTPLAYHLVSEDSGLTHDVGKGFLATMAGLLVAVQLRTQT